MFLTIIDLVLKKLSSLDSWPRCTHTGVEGVTASLLHSAVSIQDLGPFGSRVYRFCLRLARRTVRSPADAAGRISADRSWSSAAFHGPLYYLASGSLESRALSSLTTAAANIQIHSSDTRALSQTDVRLVPV